MTGVVGPHLMLFVAVVSSNLRKVNNSPTQSHTDTHTHINKIRIQTHLSSSHTDPNQKSELILLNPISNEFKQQQNVKSQKN